MKNTANTSNLLTTIQSLNQWPDIKHIVYCLDKKGYKAWLVGGCIRDILCDVTPKDIDFATDANPEIIEKTFPQTLSIGKNFGTITVCKGNKNYEITSFRSDGSYKDGRHPEDICFSNPEKDAQRRDFTCNALFFDTINNQLIDFVDGIKDILKKQIRAVGLAEERFAEDGLRLFRAIRFAAQLDWDIEKNTLQAITKQKSHITKISAERVREELFKTLLAKNHKRGLDLLELTQLLQTFLGPSFSSLTLPQINLYGDINARLATLIYQWPLNDKKAFLEKIKFSKKHINYILSLSSILEKNLQDMSLSQLRKLASNSCFEDICSLLKALDRKKDLNLLKDIKKMYPKLPDPLLSGDDLKNMGFSTGEALGQTLEIIRESQLNNEVQNKQDAINLLKTLKNKSHL